VAARAFGQSAVLLYDRLRCNLRAYVHYRNYVRGYHALHGKPAISRLNEHSADGLVAAGEIAAAVLRRSRA
jgi:hypothetical protein